MVLDILAISTACATSVNRNIYVKYLNDGYKIELVVPNVVITGSGYKVADAKRPQDPDIHYLKLVGRNPRVFNLKYIERLLIKKRPKVVILDNDPASLLSLRIGLICWFFKIRLFNFSYENIPYSIIQFIKRRGMLGLSRYLVKFFFLKVNRRFISGVFVTNDIGFSLFNFHRYENVTLVPLGFDANTFFPDNLARMRVRNKYGLDNVVIAYFGRLSVEKGVHLLVEALSGLKQYNWTLLLDEFKDYRDPYVSIVHNLILEYDISDRVKFVNPTHENIADYMNASDVVVLPSISTSNWAEQFGRVAVEALACGKFLVASNSGYLPILIAEHGLIFEQEKVGELEQILQKFILVQSFDEDDEKSWTRHNFVRANYSIEVQYNLMKTITN